MSVKHKRAMQDICSFVVKAYAKLWLRCGFALEEPNQDLWFLKTLKCYEKFQKFSKVAWARFANIYVIYVKK